MKFDTILIFEPKRVEDFYPFSIMHPVWELRCGVFKLYEKYQNEFPGINLAFTGREKHLDSFLARTGFNGSEIGEGGVLVIDGSLMPNKGFAEALKNKYAELTKTTGIDSPVMFLKNCTPIGIYIPAKEIAKNSELQRKNLLSDLDIYLYSKFPKIELDNCTKFNYSWDPIYTNGKAISDDLKFLPNYKTLDPSEYTGVWAINPENIHLGENCKIDPGTVLDATDGPIILGNNVNIMPHATIYGPAFIGDNCLVKIGAKIYHDCTFGEWCKIGGEVENAIIHAYSNKQHEGFLGHAYLGEWVNLGAGTNNSDLKNTYSDITIRMEDREIKTDRMFLGVICGDHTKTGINAMFTTGTVCGIAGILVREWFLPNFIPSFSWGGAKNSPVYKVVKAIETAKIVMARRGKILLPEEEALMIAEYERIAR